MTDHDAMLTELHRQRDIAEANVARYGRHLENWTVTRSGIEAQIKRTAEAKVAEQRAKAPTEPYYKHTAATIRFRRKFATDPFALEYTFAAIRAGREPRPWAITQTSRGPAPKDSMTWAQLLDFIGPDYWDTIELFIATTVLEPAAPAEPVTVDALTINHIGSAWIDDDGDRWEYRDGNWHWRESGSAVWNKATNIILPDSDNAPYTRVGPVAPAADPRNRIGATHSYKGADYHGSDAPEWTL